jgi:hypothetical protein
MRKTTSSRCGKAGSSSTACASAAGPLDAFLPDSETNASNVTSTASDYLRTRTGEDLSTRQIPTSLTLRGALA